ncbi:hypothetical protein F4780DRAFT_794022 [Xylariomycetidae sp. FL0641]|nr:hypothetical protein F4780DRAFT_794022 [Xylariomycetidae sp. FL0641]
MFRTTKALLPNTLKHRQARVRPYATIVDADGKCHDLTFGDIDNASNRAAWFLDRALKGEEKFIYKGPNDVRTLIWALAAMKTCKCAVFSMPQNSLAVDISFFKTVGATNLIYAPESTGMLKDLLRATQGTMKSTVTPSYSEILSTERVQPYPFDKTFDEVKDLAFMAIHTSGTSGDPKPVYWNHLALASTLSFLDPSVQRKLEGGSSATWEVFQNHTVLVLNPLFQFGGLGPMLSCIHCDSTIVLPGPGVQPTPENVTTMLRAAHCTSGWIPPAILQAMLGHAAGMRALAGLRRVAYTGTPLDAARGAALARRLPHLFPVMASTEGGPAHLLYSGDDDGSKWNAFRFAALGQRMDAVAPGLHELVFPRTATIERTYAYFHTLRPLRGDDAEYRTADLYAPLGGDGNSGWWVYKGRADSRLRLATGQLLYPTELEGSVSAHPGVRGALVAGAGRARPCLLVELGSDDDDDDPEQMLERLWPRIEAANRAAPAHARVPRALVLFARPAKPFPRSAKGTVARRQTLEAYAEEIEQMYARAEEVLRAEM